MGLNNPEFAASKATFVDCEERSMYFDDFTLPVDEENDDAYYDDDDDDGTLSDWSDDCSIPSLNRIDQTPRRPAFRLDKNQDVAQPVYEGWTIFVAPNEEELVKGKLILGRVTKQYVNYPDNRVSIESTDHSQEQLAALHLDALDKHHGSHRSASNSCLPLRRIFSRRARTSYDDAVDARIRKLSERVQMELSDLLYDRGQHSSTLALRREFCVVSVQERLRHRFAKTEPTPAHRHRLRWWKDNARGQETEFFVVLMGRPVNSVAGRKSGAAPVLGGPLASLPHYERRTNPWRNVDRAQARRALAATRSRTWDEDVVPTRPFPRPALRRRPAPPPPAPTPPRNLSMHPPPPPPPFNPMMPAHVASHGYGFRAGPPGFMGPPPPAPPPPAPFGPAPHQQPWMTGQHQPFINLPAPPMAPRPPVYAQTLRMPPGWPAPHPPPPPPMGMPILPHPRSYFAGPPPSSSWPPSPASARYSAPGTSYGAPPPLANPFSAMTTPSSLGSMHVPMFGPVPPPPPPPPPPYGPAYSLHTFRCPQPPAPLPRRQSPLNGYMPPRRPVSPGAISVLSVCELPTSPILPRPVSPASVCSDIVADLPPVELRASPSPSIQDFDFDSFLNLASSTTIRPVPQPRRGSASSFSSKDQAKSLAKDKPDSMQSD